MKISKNFIAENLKVNQKGVEIEKFFSSANSELISVEPVIQMVEGNYKETYISEICLIIKAKSAKAAKIAINSFLIGFSSSVKLIHDVRKGGEFYYFNIIPS